MAINSVAALDALIALWQTVTSVQSVTAGPPESIATRASVYVAYADDGSPDRATGLVENTTRFICGVYYRVGGAEADAERNALAIRDQFKNNFFTGSNHDRTLGGVVETCALDRFVAGEAVYQIVAGTEFRVMPVLVTVTQTLNIGD